MAEGGESRAGQRGRGRGKCWQARPEARRDAEPTSQTQFWAPGGPASRSFQSPVGRRDAGTGTRRLPEAELKHGEQLHRQMPLRCPAAVSFLHLSGRCRARGRMEVCAGFRKGLRGLPAAAAPSCGPGPLWLCGCSAPRAPQTGPSAQRQHPAVPTGGCQPQAAPAARWLHLQATPGHDRLVPKPRGAGLVGPPHRKLPVSGKAAHLPAAWPCRTSGAGG